MFSFSGLMSNPPKESKQRLIELVSLAEQYQLAAWRFDVHELVLIRSELHATGARYTTLATMPLQS
jgi:2'-5' RNA ligase